MESTESKNYLPKVYEKSKDSLYSHVVFQVLSDVIKLNFHESRILDLGCADKRSSRLLRYYGLKITEYCGVDYNPEFHPDLNADVRDFSLYYEQVGFNPNVVLITDVLEHLENGVEDVQKLLKDLSSKISSDSKVYISAPQMYRLDRFKFKHLFYPEHKIRMTLSEWENLVRQNFVVEKTIGVGYVSVIPYLFMLLPFYKENAWTGSLFRKTRTFLSQFSIIRKADYALSIQLQSNGFFCQFSNSALFVCRKKENKIE